MRRLLKTIDRISEWVGVVTSYFVIPVVVVLVIETLLRYIFHIQTTWVEYVIINLIGPFFLLGGGAWVMLHKGHVNVDLFYTKWSVRTKAIVDLCTAVVFYIFAVVLLWKGIEWGWDSVMTKSNSGPPFSGRSTR